MERFEVVHLVFLLCVKDNRRKITKKDILATSEEAGITISDRRFGVICKHLKDTERIKTEKLPVSVPPSLSVKLRCEFPQ
jgi:ribosomal protein L12E/L44/L45/RPP1/RPP2